LKAITHAGDYRVDDDAVAEDVLDKVDQFYQHINGELAEVTQAGISSAEVVNRQLCRALSCCKMAALAGITHQHTRTAKFVGLAPLTARALDTLSLKSFLAKLLPLRCSAIEPSWYRNSPSV
jgi:hypothetical protein